MAEQSSGRVFLVGAGPGDPSLCTVRGVRCLTEADLVLYDALAHPDLLAHAKQASLEFVGKRAGRKSARQEQINQRMKEAANAGQTVVRLKGGDPYLFGRGSEEAEFLAREGIPFEVVPGVPSPIVATAYAGLSLTHRTLASSVAYLTATESPAKDRSSHDWAKLATGPETLVIFMGLRRLRSLMGLLIEHGRSADTPVALVSRASLPSQRTVIGTVATIADQAEEADLPTPALVIVGQVVTLRSSLRWFDRKPLFGQRVLVTRPRAQAASFCERLRDAAAAPVVAPTVRIVPPEDPEPLVRAVKELRRYRWVLFTSKNGVDRFFAEVERQGLDARALGNAQVAAIGPGTARAILRYGVRADLIPDVFRGEAL
ncbi:MAG: uroporphyrinogen-III C-methyltransferase, partial [Myxococcota bacterium]